MLSKRVDVKVGFTCNNNCRFCVQAHKKQFGDRSTSEIKKDLDLAKQECSDVVFTGGEPTIRKDIIELVSYAAKLGFDRIQIQTNGRRLCYEDFCSELMNAGANEFGVALHGHTSELHDFLTRSKGSFNQTVQAIKNLKELKQLVITNTVIVKPNYRFAPDIARLLADLGVDQYQLAFVHPIGNAYKYYDSMVPLFTLAAPLIHQGLHIGIDAGLKVMAEAMPLCHMAGYEQYISETKIPPTQIRDVFDVDPDYEKTRKTKGKQKFDNCKKCRYDNSCEGPWKEYPEKKGGLEFVPVG
jgi:molybdenum cofactor biosynthesis enzyme MoaA